MRSQHVTRVGTGAGLTSGIVWRFRVRNGDARRQIIAPSFGHEHKLSAVVCAWHSVSNCLYSTSCPLTAIHILQHVAFVRDLCQSHVPSHPIALVIQSRIPRQCRCRFDIQSPNDIRLVESASTERRPGVRSEEQGIGGLVVDGCFVSCSVLGIGPDEREAGVGADDLVKVGVVDVERGRFGGREGDVSWQEGTRVVED